MTSQFVKSSVLFEQDGKLQESEKNDKSIQQFQRADLSEIYKSVPKVEREKEKVDVDSKELQNYQNKLLNNDHLKNELYNEEDFDYFNYYGQLQEDENKRDRFEEVELQKLRAQRQKMVITLQEKEKQEIVLEKKREEEPLIKKRKLKTIIRTDSKNQEQDNKEEEPKIEKQLKKEKSLIQYGSDSENDEEEQQEKEKKKENNEQNEEQNNGNLNVQKIDPKVIQQIVKEKQQEQKEKQTQEKQKKLNMLSYDSDSD